jgi:predicted metal-binding transcription factor (methanogenesis marker protein 9)
MEVQVSKLKMAKYTVRITEIGTRSSEIVAEAASKEEAERKAWIRGGDFDDPLEPDERIYEVIDEEVQADNP